MRGGMGPWGWWRSRHSSPRRARRTLLDEGNVESVIRLVQILDRGDGAEGLADRLTRLFSTFPPDDDLMSRLSLLHQRYEREGGLEGYCATFVYMTATERLLRLPAVPRRPTLRATRSLRSVAAVTGRRTRTSA